MLKRIQKNKNQITFALAMALIIFAVPLSAVYAADGSTGNIQASAQIFHVSGSPISISMWNLGVSSDYHLNWTGENTGISFTTSATQTKYSHTFVLTSTSSTVTFYLRAQSAGTVIDQTQVSVVDLADFLSTGLIISAGIFVLIIVIFKRVAKG